MNVLNKLKSKKNKQASQPAPIIQPKNGIPPFNPTQTVPPPPLKALIEIKTNSSHTQLSAHMEQDLQEDQSIDLYYKNKDKQKQMMSMIETSENFSEEYLKESHFCLHVKKCFNIADVSVFQGQLVFREVGKEKYRKKVKISCGIQTIQFPEAVSKILLRRVILLNDFQGLFLHEDIIKIAEKKYAKK